MRESWAVLISGRGSNLASLLEHADEIPIAVVVSSKAGVDGLAKARRAGVRCLVLDKKIDWASLTVFLRLRGVTRICLAGFMRIVPAAFVAEWRGRITNLHPSLLPKYPGVESIAAAHSASDEMGVTVHDVDEGVDTGSVILQRRCLKKSEVGSYPLALAEFFVHVTEQRLLTRAVRALTNVAHSTHLTNGGTHV